MTVRSIATAIAIGVAATLAGAPAQAADVAASGSYAATPTWTGFYAGGWVGGRSSEITATDCGGGGIIGQNCPTNFGLDGTLAGVAAGYDYQFANRLVLGAFISAPLVRPTTRVTTPLFAPFDISWSVRPRWATAFGVRAGYAFDRYMPYVLGGLSVARVEVTPSFGSPVSATHTGPAFGGGLEVRLTDNISLDARYLFTMLGSSPYQFCPDPGCRSEYKENAHNFSVGLNFRF